MSYAWYMEVRTESTHGEIQPAEALVSISAEAMISYTITSLTKKS
jgi:hypothetical protein